MNEAVYAMGNDWEGFYINGKLVDEGHHLEFDFIIPKVISENVKTYRSKWINLEWLDWYGSFPENIEDVVWDDQEWEVPSLDD